MFYIPIWLALMNHFLLKNDKLSVGKTIGLCGHYRGNYFRSSTASGGLRASIIGDLCALLGSIGWAYFAFYSKNSRLSGSHQIPNVLCFPCIRTNADCSFYVLWKFCERSYPIALCWFSFQVLFASIGFIFWVWLFKRYSATTVASFSFLTPIMGIFFGWLLLSEQLSSALFLAGLLVIGGSYLVTRVETRLTDKSYLPTNLGFSLLRNALSP